MLSFSESKMEKSSKDSSKEVLSSAWETGAALSGVSLLGRLSGKTPERKHLGKKLPIMQ